MAFSTISEAAEAAAVRQHQQNNNDKSALLNCGKFTEKDLTHFRQIAFVAVALSTVTMLACIVVMPIAYQYIQRVQSSITSDIEFCRVKKIQLFVKKSLFLFQSRNRDLWSEVLLVQQNKGQHTHVERLKRSTAESHNGQW